MNNTVVLDLKQDRAMSFYKDPASDTFGNLKRSLMKAGYSEKYANTIGGRDLDWITESMKNTIDLVQKAEQNLRDYVELCLPLTSESNKTEVDIAKMKLDASKFILKNLASGKYKSVPEQQNETGNITLNITNYNAPSKTLPILEAQVIEPIDIVQE
jgi:hypothetical protein